MEANTTPDLQQDDDSKTHTEIDSTVGAGTQDEQTPSVPEGEEYDEIVLAGDEQASRYTKEEVLVHKLSKVRKQKAAVKTEVSQKDAEIEALKKQMQELRSEFGFEDEPAAVPTQQAQAAPQAPQIDEKVFNNHYNSAAKLKVKDYEETERSLRSSLGDGLVDSIIAECDAGKSPMVVYHLQKNKDRLEEFTHALQIDPTGRKAQRLLWGLSEKLKVNQVKRDPVPAPESEVRGAASGSSPEKQLDTLRDKYVAEINSGGDGAVLWKQMKELKSQIRSQ